MTTPPEFREGNRWFAKALNEVVAFAMKHGVNPKGVPGWRQTAHGWKPPFIDPTIQAPALPWSLDPSGENGGFIVSPGSVEFFTGGQIAVDSSPFSPTAGDVAWLEYLADDLGSASVVVGEPWDEYPRAYEIEKDDGEADWRIYRLPLWRFDAVDSPGAEPVGENVFAVRLVFSHLRMIYAGMFWSDGEDAFSIVPPVAIPWHRNPEA